MGKGKEFCRTPCITIELLQDYCTVTQLDDWEEGEERKRNKKCFENVRNVYLNKKWCIHKFSKITFKIKV